MAKSFASVIERNPNKPLIVDALNLSFRWKHSGQFEFSDSYINTVQSLASSYKCGKIIITADQGSSSYRKALLPSYKGNREALKAKQTDKEKEDFLKFWAGYEQALLNVEAEGYPVLRYNKVEADDIAAFLIKHRKELGIEEAVLVSSDRDWDLLLEETVSRFSYVTRKDYTLANWADTYDFDHDHYITYKCLVGDKGDNIPGIAGIGDKRASGIIKDYPSVFDLYDAHPLPGKYKYIQNLNEDIEKLLLNLELMDLRSYCDEAIGVDNAKDIVDRIQEYMEC